MSEERPVHRRRKQAEALPPQAQAPQEKEATSPARRPSQSRPAEAVVRKQEQPERSRQIETGGSGSEGAEGRYGDAVPKEVGRGQSAGRRAAQDAAKRTPPAAPNASGRTSPTAAPLRKGAGRHSDGGAQHAVAQPHANAQQKKRETDEPLLIVAAKEELPEWMVSADSVSGAASRRTKRFGGAEEEAKSQAPQPHTEEPVPRPSKPRPGEGVSFGEKLTPQPARGTDAHAAQPSGKKRKKLSKKERERRARQAKRTAATFLGALLAVTLVVVAAVGGGRLLDIKRTLDQGDGVFYPNIFVNNIPLEGHTLDEAAVVVGKQVADQISAWKITLRTQDGRSWDITGPELGMQYDVADQLDQLWAIGHTGSASARYEQVKSLLDEPVMRYTTLSYDMTSVNQILAQIKAEIDVPAVNATRVSDDTKWPPFSYTDDVPGQMLDITGLNDKICGMVDRLESGTVDLTPTSVEAAVTRKALEGQIVELARYDTRISTTSKAGRFINIELGTKKFNHLTIMPRETVSFNKVTGLRTIENGYAVAPELAYGDYRDGVGGGICQVSSTLYNAVVNAGLEVTQRTQHSLASSYVPLGQDATVQDNRLDFVFYNNTGAEIYISGDYYKEGGYYHCRFIIHGRPDPNGYSYKLESQVVEELPIPEPTYIPDTEAQYVVYDDQTYEDFKGEMGYVVDVYKVTLDSHGNEVGRVLDHTDTYNTRQPRVYVGVTPRTTPSPYDD